MDRIRQKFENGIKKTEARRQAAQAEAKHAEEVEALAEAMRIMFPGGSAPRFWEQTRRIRLETPIRYANISCRHRWIIDGYIFARDAIIGKSLFFPNLWAPSFKFTNKELLNDNIQAYLDKAETAKRLYPDIDVISLIGVNPYEEILRLRAENQAIKEEKQAIEEELERREQEKKVKKKRTKSNFIMPDNHCPIVNNYLMAELRENISKGNFESNEDEWPKAKLEKSGAIAEVRPDPDEITDNALIAYFQKEMITKVLSMGDLTTDVLCAIEYHYITNAKTPHDLIFIEVDDILKLRGIKKKKGGTGNRGGYERKQRMEIAKQIDLLSNTWLTIYKDKNNRGWESRVIKIDDREGQITIDGRVEPDTWLYKMGTAIAEFIFNEQQRQIAYISCKALSYDPDKQKWEKRITYYLTWLWRIRQSKDQYSEPFKVEVLLEHIEREDAIKKKVVRPGRIRERLEKALDKIQEDGVIKKWQYEDGFNEDSMSGKEWYKKWLKSKIIILPPDEIIKQYNKISNPKKKKLLPSPKPKHKKQVKNK